MNGKLNSSDTFLEWMEKINGILDNVDTVVTTADSSSISFSGIGSSGDPLSAEVTSVESSKVIGLGTAATQDVGITPGTVAAGNDSRIVNAASKTELSSGLNLKADKTTQVIAGTGLSGGGTLAANRTLSVDYGTAAGTATQGNDSRVVNAVQSAGTGLTKSGTSLSVNYGTTAGTAAQGNDSRIVNAVQTAGTGLTKSGTTLSVNYGTTSTTAARGDDSRITGAMQKSANLSDLSNAEAARSNLGLGTAALANTTAGPLDNTVGRVLKVGDHGIGSTTTQRNYNETPSMGGFYSFAGDGTEAGAYSSYINVGYHALGYGFQILMKGMGGLSVGDTLMVRRHGEGGWGPFVTLYHSGNTTVDPNGFVKKASPIVNLFSNSIEKTEHLEIEDIELERVAVGHYVLHNAPLLSRDGWYIETPKDRNNNIYFYLDYEENETDKTLTIKTYEPNYSSGRAEAGEPVDILEGRYVSLRFSEDPTPI